MGQYAASGGYYISAPADKIVAMPTTITGSIGVVGGKLAFEKAYAKLGYNVERIAIGGDYLGAYSVDTPFSNTQKSKFHAQLDIMYQTFIGLVSEGRNMSLDEVHNIAKGRVWTGAQAHEIGLVDELGGILTAINIAKSEAGIDAKTNIHLKSFPRPKPFVERLSEQLSGMATLLDDLKLIRQLKNHPEFQAVISANHHMSLSQEPSFIANVPFTETQNRNPHN